MADEPITSPNDALLQCSDIPVAPQASANESPPEMPSHARYGKVAESTAPVPDCIGDYRFQRTSGHLILG